MATSNLVTKHDLQQELKKVENRLENRMDIGFKRVDSRFTRLENKIIKKLNIIAEFFDKPILEYEKRIIRVENHLGLGEMTN